MTKAALLVASSDYQDPKFRQLRAPAHDVGALARVLGDPEIGGFAVRTLLNELSWTVSEAIETFFADRKLDDLLLLYFSCHGIKDASGQLYFAAKNTKFQLPASTGISSGWVNDRISSSRSRRVVLFLDCCYSGAFARGLAHRSAGGVEIAERFGGRGRVVITASDAMEYAYEGDTLTMDAGQPSVFTSALVHGLETGEADRDGDGRVGVNELYDYVHDRVHKTTPSQTPTMSTLGLEGELYLARNPRPPPPPVEPVLLPFELRQAVESELAWHRAGAVTGLKRLLASDRPGLALAARQALTALTEDDDVDVRAAATAALVEPSAEPVVAAEPAKTPTAVSSEDVPTPDPPSAASQGAIWPNVPPRHVHGASVVTPTETGGVPPEALAGFGIRSASALIDLCTLFVLSAVLAGVVVGIRATAISTFWDWICVFIAGSAYFTCLHGSVAGQSIGNKVCRIRLISSGQGGRVPYARAFARWLMSLVSAVVFGIGFVQMLLDLKNQTWHDKVAGTYVVKTALYPPPRRPRGSRSRRT